MNHEPIETMPTDAIEAQIEDIEAALQGRTPKASQLVVLLRNLQDELTSRLGADAHV